MLDDVLAGGTGTPPGASVVTTGGGATTTLPGAQLTFEIESPKRVGQSIGLTLEGPPGQQAWLLKALAPGGVVKPGWGGVFLISPAQFALAPLGPIPPSGALSLAATVPSIAGLDALPSSSRA